MNKTGWIVFATVIVLLLGGLVAYARVTNPPVDVSGVNNNSVATASTQNGNIAEHTKGSSSNKILLIEYGDYQCPSCAEAYSQINTLMEDYSNSVTFVFRNYPLVSIHPNSKAASAAAEAAGLQGKYWEMHDMLYKNQDDWSDLNATQRTTVFKQYAESIGLNTKEFETAVSSKTVTQKINFDIARGKKESISATPTFYLNGSALDSTTADSLVQGDLTSIKEKLDALVKENS